MEHWKNNPSLDKSEGHLFDPRPYIIHQYLFPNVIELKPVREVSTGHDDAFDNLKCEEAQEATVYQFPQQQELPPQAA